jgi:hypothetical protein
MKKKRQIIKKDVKQHQLFKLVTKVIRHEIQ